MIYYNSTERCQAHAGLFWPSGFQIGSYFCLNGDIKRVTEQVAYIMSKRDGVEFVRADSYRHCQP